jgi:hypothetical protein
MNRSLTLLSLLLLASLALGCSSGSNNGPGDAGRPGDASADRTTGADRDEVDAGNAFFDAEGCAVGDAGEPLDLRCTGLYSDWATKTVSPENQPYTPGLVLWSDSAVKSRWIYLPKGQKIDTSNMDEWTFPVGTRIWKEFSLPVSAPVRIETRLIWKLHDGFDGWYYTTYRWSADGKTSATETTAGELDANGAGYEVPSHDECDDCHKGREDFVMGFEAVSLSLPDADGLAMAALLDAGRLTAPPASNLAIPGDATAAAALGWLHVNCGISCHNRAGGVAGASGFSTRLDVATLGSVQDTDTWTTGWNKPALKFTIPDAATSDVLHACSLATSAAYYRAAHRDGVDGDPADAGIQMPPFDTHRIDVAGLALLAAWINEGCDAGGGDASAGTADASDASADGD